MTSKYKKYGSGWFEESERHSLARRGIKTGRRSEEKTSIMMKTVFPHIPMTFRLSPGSKEFINHRGKEKEVLDTLKSHGWKFKFSIYPPPGAYEGYKGNNYLMLDVTHWKKLKISKISIVDPNELHILRKLFRKPYPYTIPDYSKQASTEQQINKILYEPGDVSYRKVLTIEIPRNKSHNLDFLKAYTEFNTVGVWKNYKDKNIQVEIEFKDDRNDTNSKRLLNLVQKLNKDKIKEKVIYARVEPIEKSTLNYSLAQAKLFSER